MNHPVWRAITHRWEHALFLAILSLTFFPIFLGDVMFMRDSAHWSYPLRIFMRHSLLTGHLPAWDPYQGLGFSLAANPLVGLAYPPNWLYLLPWTANLVTLDSFLHLLLGGLGIMATLRLFSLRGLPVLFGGLAWSLSGITIGYWTAGLLLQGFAWIPWMMMSGILLSRAAWQTSPGIRLLKQIALASIPFALALLQGELFIATMGIFTGLALGAALTVFHTGSSPDAVQPRLGRRLLRFGLMSIGMIALGCCLGGINLIPVLAAQNTTDRAFGLTRFAAEVWSLHPWRLLEMLAPGGMGHPLKSFAGKSVVGDIRINRQILIFSVHVGSIAFLLAITAFGKKKPVALFLGICACFALTLALGHFLPVHAIWRTLVPVFALMRFPEKYLAVFIATFALLVGFGMAETIARPSKAIRWGMGLIVALALVAFFPHFLPAPIQSTMRVGLRDSILALACFLVTLWISRRAKYGLGVGTAIFVLNLTLPTWALMEFISPKITTQRPPILQHILAARMDPLAPPRILRDSVLGTVVAKNVPVHTPEGYESREMLTLIPNIPNVYGVASLPGYDAAVPSVWNKLFTEGTNRTDGRILQLSSTEFMLLPDPIRKIPYATLEATPLVPLPGSRLYRVRNTLPRVYAVGRTDSVPPSQVLNRILQEDVAAGTIAILPPGSPSELSSAPPGRAGHCTFTTYTPNYIAVQCSLDRKALVVFGEQYAPGWRAWLDDQPIPIQSTNYVMRGIFSQAGQHHITMNFVPPGRRLGLLLSVMGLGIFAMALALPRWATRGWHRALWSRSAIP